jgi:hypothetical protein
VSSTPTLDHQAQAHDAETLRRALATVNAEHAFDRLNPDFGIAADHYQREGHQAVQQREAALALGTRTTVAIQREEVGPPAWRQDRSPAVPASLPGWPAPAKDPSGPARNANPPTHPPSIHRRP